MAVLSIHNVSKSYTRRDGSVRALRDVSLEVDEGRFVVVHGPSGSGKTTLLLSAGGLLAPDDGQVTIDSRDVYDLSADRRAELRAAAVGFVFQQFHLIGYLSVLDNVLVPALAGGLHAAENRARELIERLGLSGRAGHLPGELSTGERQRTALARAMLREPRLLLADEPTGNLDEDNAGVVMESLAQFAADGGAVLLVTHDRAAESYAHHAIRLSDGYLSEA